MLTEIFLASVETSGKQLDRTPIADAGVFIHTLQPLPALKSTFKKSSTKPHCLAISASHVFAAQADKATIHVYNRERGHQEAVIPFQERISSLVLAGSYDGAAVLVAGSEGGRVILWEVCGDLIHRAKLIERPSSSVLAVKCSALRLTSRPSVVWQLMPEETTC